MYIYINIHDYYYDFYHYCYHYYNYYHLPYIIVLPTSICFRDDLRSSQGDGFLKWYPKMTG